MTGDEVFSSTLTERGRGRYGSSARSSVLDGSVMSYRPRAQSEVKVDEEASRRLSKRKRMMMVHRRGLT